MTHHIDLATIKLDSGGHSKAQAAKGQACLMEWVAIFAGVDYGDHPVCTSLVLGAFGRNLNDGLPDADRQRLIPFIPRLVGTAGDPQADEIRAWMATDWLVRTFTPVWLRKAGLVAQADAVAGLPELTSAELATSALDVIRSARKDAEAARAAAGAAAWAAAGEAAWAAAGAAARAAAGAAAGAAAREAAGAAARAAAGAAAGAAAREAARAAARAAAWAAAGAAARAAARAAAGAAAWAAAGAAAGAAASKKKSYSEQYSAAYKAVRPIMDVALAETKAELLDSALELFGRMCDVRVAVPA